MATSGVTSFARSPLAAVVDVALVTGDSRNPESLALFANRVVHASVLQARMLRTGREHALATDLDLRLLAQTGALLPPGCAVVNNYGDAGQWIPALLGRPITFPQANVLFFDLRERVHPCAAFRGEKRPYHVDTVPCPGAACASLARAGAAELFRIVDPALTVEISPAR